MHVDVVDLTTRSPSQRPKAGRPDTFPHLHPRCTIRAPGAALFRRRSHPVEKIILNVDDEQAIVVSRNDFGASLEKPTRWPYIAQSSAATSVSAVASGRACDA